MINKDIVEYNNKLVDSEEKICNILAKEIDSVLTKSESKIWHRHPVWFLEGNPIVGYSKQKAGIRLMFWSGKDFKEEALNKQSEKFKDASIIYNEVSEINSNLLKRWLKKSKEIQWDYKNIVKVKGRLVKLKSKKI